MRATWLLLWINLSVPTLGLWAQETSPCNKAGAFKAAGLLDESRNEYVTLLEKTPELECAVTGLAELPRLYLGRALAFKAAGDTEEAKKDLRAAMRLEQATNADQEPSEIEKELRAAVADHYAEAKKLWALNQQAEAVNKLQEARAAHPNAPFPDDLETAQTSIWAKWLPKRRWLASWVAASPFTAALCLAVIWVVLRALLRFRVHRAWATPLLILLSLGLMRWAAWDVILSLPLAALLGMCLYAWFRQPRLDIHEFTSAGLEGDVGKDFTPLVRTQLLSLRHPDQSASLSITKAQISTFEIPAAVGDIVPGGAKWVSAVPSLLKLFALRRTIVLTGELHPPGDNGLGVTVELMEGPRYISGETMWETDFGLPPTTKDKGDVRSGFYMLAEVVAVWLLFELAAAYE